MQCNESKFIFLFNLNPCDVLQNVIYSISILLKVSPFKLLLAAWGVESRKILHSYILLDKNKKEKCISQPQLCFIYTSSNLALA